MVHPQIQARRHSLGAAVAAAILVLALLVLVSGAAAAPSGTVTGKIVDSSRDPLADANVIIPDLQMGTRSRSDGTYVIEGVPVGSWLGPSVRPGKETAPRTNPVETRPTSTSAF